MQEIKKPLPESVKVNTVEATFMPSNSFNTKSFVIESSLVHRRVVV